MDERETGMNEGTGAEALSAAESNAVTRRELLSRLAGVAGAAAVGAAITGTPARLLAATDDWRVAPPHRNGVMSSFGSISSSNQGSSGDTTT